MPESNEAEAVRHALREALIAVEATPPPEPGAALRARSGRRAVRMPDAKLVAAAAAVLILVVALLTAGALHRSSQQPSPVHRTGYAFSVRPVRCFAPHDDAAAGPSRPGAVTCTPRSSLTASAIGITPIPGSSAGYTSNLGALQPDAQLSDVPSTPATHVTPQATVLLPGAPGGGTERYVLGPAGITGADVASAKAVETDGQWSVLVVLTPTGATAWDDLAHQQFHALIAVVLHDQVLSAPVVQPVQSSFTAFGGRLEVSGNFTRAQAVAAAQAIATSH